MYLVAIGWIYVVLMMSVAEALSSQGTVLGAVITFVFYGVLPLVVVMYIMGTPSRRRARLAAEAAEAQAASAAAAASGPMSSSPSPDGRSQAAADTVAAERKEP
jgi:Na+-transporting methylmalonyl-CoA/oxaloacetate decarboxylase gamma subunit